MAAPPPEACPVRNADHKFEWTRAQFREWIEGLNQSSEESYGSFVEAWQEVDLVDIPGSSNWLKDVQAVLYKWRSNRLRSSSVNPRVHGQGVLRPSRPAT